MCVAAVVQTNSTVQYTLTVKQSQVGWMALCVATVSSISSLVTVVSPVSNSGFGTQMINSPIVLMWRDPSSGEVVLSQRKTSTYTIPTVDPSPSRIANALQYKTSSTSSETSLSFEIASTAETSQNIIYSYCKTAPSTPSDPNSSITMHNNQGTAQLTLTKTIGNGTSSDSDDDDDTPLTNTQRMLLAHGIFMAAGFLFALPFGATFVRLTRTWIPGRIWFATHWICQWLLAGVLITVGFALGVATVEQEGKPHFSDNHRVRRHLLGNVDHI
jgi:hypothetical protein